MPFVPSLHHRLPGARLLAVAALCALSGALPTTAGAAATRASRSALADTTKPATFLHEVVVTGARYPRKFYQSPQALSFVTSAQLREQPPVTIGDVLSTLPGVDISKDSPWEQRPVLRGVGGQRALVLVDGIPMNSARGNGPHPSLVDPSQIDHVEVVRGPSSVAYGSDALGGAINIITRGIQPSTSATEVKLNGNVALSGSTGDNQYGGSLDLQPRFGKLGLDLNGGGRHADDFKAPDGKIPHSAFRDWDGSAQARYDYDELTVLKAGWQMYRGKDIGIPGLSTPTASGYPPGWLDVFSFKNYDRDLANVSVERSYPHSWISSSQVRLYYQGERRNFFDAQDLVPRYYLMGPPDGSTSQHGEFNRYFNLKTWGGQVQATSVKTKDYRFTMGLDVVRDVTAGNNVSGTNEVFPSGPGATTVSIAQSVPSGHFDNYGAYFENEWYVLPQWTLSTGARYTQYAYRTEAGVAIPADYLGPGSPAVLYKPMTVNNGAASGSAGVVYSPTSDLHLSFNVANGYRQPNAQDLFFNGFGSVGLVHGNPDLKPEKSVSYDVGLRYENSREALSGNLFYTTYTDLIDAVVEPHPETDAYFGTFRYANISKARIWGGEAEGQWVVIENISAHATVAGAIGDNTSSSVNVPLGGVPPLKGSFGLRWDDSGRRFWAEPSMRYSWRTNRLPPPTGNVEQLVDFKKEWLVVDVMAGMRIDYVHRITLGVRNVGDRRYREALASLPSPGRALVASFSASF